MNRFIFLLLCIAVLLFKTIPAKCLLPGDVDIYSHPPKTIRVCCLFGAKVGITGLPFIKLTAVTSPEKIGQHCFLGKTSENNGLLYTGRGGFIDMGHLRDIADWTAWVYALIQNEQSLGCIRRNLGYEGGVKILEISVPPGISDEDMLLLAGRIAYDLSVWHEIATWFGVKSVPLVPEQFSSFSVEDTYSNLLGVLLGMEAIRSRRPYEEAMTELIRKKLEELEAVGSEKETLDALESVRDVWWTRNAHLPSNKVSIIRQTTVYEPINPLLIPGQFLCTGNPFILVPPVEMNDGSPLTGFYSLKISLNYKFPLKNLFPGKKEKFITQDDFTILIDEINRQYQTMIFTDLHHEDRDTGSFLQMKRIFKKIKKIG
jgi:hypothetical protein